MNVKVVCYRKGVAYGNILWTGKWPMRYGKFPKDHPCSEGAMTIGTPEHANDSKLDNFRKLGYWASCFPEGDGITYEPLNGQSDEQQIKDVQGAFGWDVVRKKH